MYTLIIPAAGQGKRMGAGKISCSYLLMKYRLLCIRYVLSNRIKHVKILLWQLTKKSVRILKS